MNIKILVGKRNNFIDVFIDDGWDNWSRVKLDKKVLHHIKGRHLTQEEANYVFNHTKSR